MTPDVQALLDLIQQFGIWIIFAYLYVQERRDHGLTRQRLETELSAARAAHMADIREIAGMRQSLYSLNPLTSVPRDQTRPAGATGGNSTASPLAPEG